MNVLAFLVVFSFLALPTADAGGGDDCIWSLAPDGRSVTVTTKSLIALFRDGGLVSLESRAGGERLFVGQPASSAAPALQDRTGLCLANGATRVAAARNADGAEIALRGVGQDPSARLELKLATGKGGDLLVTQSARRQEPELLAASWGISGIDASKVKVILPANGGLEIDGLRGPGSLSLPWPGAWQAALAILQGREGGFCIWAENRDASFLSLELRRSGRELSLRFATESRSALSEARRVDSPVWRVRAYCGDWKVPALAYRDAMSSWLGLVPIADRRPGWIRDTRLVVRVADTVTVEHLSGLASQVDPRQTLLYVPGWRKLPYDVLYPDYEPREGFIDWCRAAQSLGFRVMPHANLVGIGPKSRELQKVDKLLQTDRRSGDRVGWYLDKPDHPGQIYCINPASAEARRLLIEHFLRAWERVRFDALHLDYPVIVSTHDGEVDGMTSARGAIVYLRELQKALPHVALGTEGLHEALLACSFAQLGEPMWVRPAPGIGIHPIRSFLFAPYCGLYGHLGMPSQATSFAAYLEHHDFFDRLGSWPTLSLDGALDPANPGTDFALCAAKYFQVRKLVPAPEEVRFPEELFAWRGIDGGISAVLDVPPGRRLGSRPAPGAGASPGVAWELLSRVNTYEGPGCVAGWRAFDGAHLFGLNPERRYPVVSRTPDPLCLHLAFASRPIVVEEVRDSPRRSFFRLSGATALVAELVGLSTSAAAGVMVEGRSEPLGYGAQFEAVQSASGGEPLPGIAAHPPWQGLGTGGLTWGEFPVDLPSKGRTVFRFAIGLGDLTEAGALAQDRVRSLSDGATFVVQVDDKELFRGHHLRGKWAWHEVELSQYRAKTIVLRLLTGPGPRNDVGWDWAVWGQPRVINLGDAGEREPLRLRVISPHGEGQPFFADADSPGKILSAARAEGGCAIDVELPRPQAFGFVHDAVSVDMNADLAGMPFIVGSTSGETLVQGPVYGSGSIVGSVEAAGKSWRAVNGHPPAFGRTVLDWCLRLPETPACMRFQAQLLRGGGPVAFEVEINGAPVWSWPMLFPDGWKPGSVDLSPWSGKAILLSLVTDSMGDNNCDWAQWGAVRVEDKQTGSPPF